METHFANLHFSSKRMKKSHNLNKDNLTIAADWLVPQHLKCYGRSEMPEKSLSSKYFWIIVLHDCVPKQQHSPPKAMTAFIVFRLLALRPNYFFMYENDYIQ